MVEGCRGNEVPKVFRRGKAMGSVRARRWGLSGQGDGVGP